VQICGIFERTANWFVLGNSELCRVVEYLTGLLIGLCWDNSVLCKFVECLTGLLIGLCWDNSVLCRVVDWLTGLQIGLCRDNSILWGHSVVPFVEALRYKPEGRRFDSRWCH
jgi:hypothetical protein